MNMDLKPGGVLISASAIESRLRELAAQLDIDYASRDLVLLGILNNAFMLMADLSRMLNREALEISWMEVTSFGGCDSSSGVIRLRMKPDLSLKGRDVVVLACAVMSRLTLEWILAYVRGLGTASVTVLVVACEPSLLGPGTPVRYVGFTVPLSPMAGYGLGYAGRYRDLPYIAALVPAARAKIKASAPTTVPRC